MALSMALDGSVGGAWSIRDVDCYTVVQGREGTEFR